LEKIIDDPRSGKIKKRKKTQITDINSAPSVTRSKKGFSEGGQLLNYIEHIEKSLDNLIFEYGSNSIQFHMHAQMLNVFQAQKTLFQQYGTSNSKDYMPIMRSGLPSVDALNSNLEKICRLTRKNPDFKIIAARMKKGLTGKNKGKSKHIYTLVSENDFNLEFENFKGFELLSQKGFQLSQTEKGELVLDFKEDIFVDAPDEISKKFPALIREGKVTYKMAWKKLIDEFEVSYFLPNTSLVLQENTIESEEKNFDDICRTYKFRSSHYNMYIPPFSYWSPKMINYAKFLASGQRARMASTTDILNKLSETYEQKVVLKDVKEEAMNDILKFSDVPFENAPETAPSAKELKELNISTKFDLMLESGSINIGTLDFTLPGVYQVSAYIGTVSRFLKGHMSLKIFGGSVGNETQYKTLQKSLKTVKMR